MEHESLKASYNAQFIKNRKTQDVYDIKMSIKNTGFDLIKFKNRIGEVEYDQSEYWLAKLTFANSTGSNLTLREGYVDSKEFKQRVADGQKLEDLLPSIKKIKKWHKEWNNKIMYRFNFQYILGNFRNI